MKGFILIGSLLAALSGCSLAVVRQQDISIPIREGGFQLNANISIERLGELIGE